MPEKLCLAEFNNLTKTLSFNLYDICYAESEAQMREYLAYINEAYNALRLTQILREIARIIGARILNESSADYEPHGASVTMLVAESSMPPPVSNSETPGPAAVAMHLDKSHITVHTYPEKAPALGFCTFRVDLDVSTCGMISPLKALNHLIHSLESDILTLDYRVRGFTRDQDGKKLFIDHPISSIQNFIPHETLSLYQAIDCNIYAENLFHTRMMLREFDLDNYLFGMDSSELSTAQRDELERRLRHEMQEIYIGQQVSGHMP